MIFHQFIKELISKLYTISKWLNHIEVNDNIYLYAKFQADWLTHGYTVLVSPELM